MRKHKGLAFDLHTSMHLHVAGQTLNYYPSDTVEAETYSKAIKYRFNAQGFRCDYNMDEYGKGLQYDKSQGPINMFLGCSNTLGIGVNLEETWCQHIVNRVGGVMCNLGQAGGSAETVYRIASFWISRIKPLRVYMLSPPAVRREYWLEKHTPTVIGPRSQMPGHLLGEREIQINRQRVVDAIHYHCLINKAEFHYQYSRPIFDEWQDNWPDRARDGTHPGPICHEAIAKHFK